MFQILLLLTSKTPELQNKKFKTKNKKSLNKKNHKKTSVNVIITIGLEEIKKMKKQDGS
jgi:hypothetical protein